MCMEIDSEAFSAFIDGSSASTEAKVKRQATPKYTSSDKHDEAGSNAAAAEE